MKIGSGTIGKLMIGSTAATKAYLGAVEVWSGGYSFTDADAEAYVSAVITAGATVSDSQKETIDDFYVAEKLAGRWSSISRFYLPIWGVAAANAICLKSGTSGTWLGGITHSAGYFTSNGTTGTFRPNVTAATLGQSINSVMYGCLAYREGTTNRAHVRLGDGTTPVNLFRDGGSAIFTTDCGISGGFSGTGPAGAGFVHGMMMVSRTSTTSWRYHQRQSGGVSTFNGATTSATSISADQWYFCSRGGFSDFENADIGLMILGLGLSSANGEALTLSLKNLWEGLTGLSMQ